MMRIFAVVAFPISGELMSIILCCSSLQTFDIPFQVFIFIMLSLGGKGKAVERQGSSLLNCSNVGKFFPSTSL